MSFRYIAVAGITIAIIAVFYMFFGGTQKNNAPEITFTQIPEKAFKNELVNIKVKAISETQISKITLKTNGKTLEQPCNETECTAIFTQTFTDTGTIEVQATAQNQAGESTKKTIIKIFDDKKTCIDETPLNQCSATQPLYCDNGKLTQNCSLCGCTQGRQCNGETCISVSLPIEITAMQPAEYKIVRENTGFTIKATLTNTKNNVVSKGANYSLKTTLSGPQKTTSTTDFSLQKDLAINESEEVKTIIKGLKEGFYSIETELTAGDNIIDTYSENNFVESSTDKIPPAAPTGLKGRFEEKTLVLSWNPNTETDLAGYKLFKSQNIEATHITYALFMTLDKNNTQISIKEPQEGTQYFVLKSFDFLSNESPYGEHTRIEKR